MSERRSSDNLKAGRRAAGRAESPASSVGDPALRRLQQSMGNTGLRQQMQQGRADRALMLSHLCDRLTVMNELQQREQGMMVKGTNYWFWRDVARDGTGQATAPDPNRWHEAADAYQKAGQALCAGDLNRGMQLLERAMHVEDRTIEHMTSLIDTSDLEHETRPDPAVLDGLMEVGQVEPCEPPPALALAEEILKTTTDTIDLPKLMRTRDPWWAEEEEEEEIPPVADGE